MVELLIKTKEIRDKIIKYKDEIYISNNYMTKLFDWNGYIITASTVTDHIVDDESIWTCMTFKVHKDSYKRKPLKVLRLGFNCYFFTCDTDVDISIDVLDENGENLYHDYVTLNGYDKLVTYQKMNEEYEDLIYEALNHVFNVIYNME